MKEYNELYITIAELNLPNRRTAIAELQLAIGYWERRTTEKRRELNTRRYEEGKSNLEGMEDF